MRSNKWIFVLLLGLALLTACQARTKEVIVTQIVTEKETVFEQETILEQETIIVEVTPTPEPVIQGPRTLVICQGQEPETLYLYDRPDITAQHIQQAVYDGPIDSRSFGHQPVILEKLPSLADGDAVIQTVTVETGDLVVDDALNVVTLEPGTLVRQAGCYSSQCAVEFDGEPIEMEQMVVTFVLKEGILWSDGEPLSTLDSVYAFELLKDPDTPANRDTADRTASYEALDNLTTVWTGLPGFRDPNYMTNFWPPLPEHIWGDFTALELIEAQESARRPLGWGPYVITEWVAGDHLTLVKNENYWRADEGLPRFDIVIFRFVGQNSAANVAALLSGQCDIIDQTAGLDTQRELLLELEAVSQLDAVFGTTGIWEHVDLGINPAEGYNRPDFFEDVNVRRAIAHCLDRQTVIDSLLFGQSSVLHSFLPPEHPLYAPDVAQYNFDVVAGSEILNEAGWIDDDDNPDTPRVAQGIEGISDGTALEFNYSLAIPASASQPTQRQLAAERLQASLAQCGVQVNLDYWSRDEYLVGGPDGPIFGRRFDLTHFAWVTDVEPRCDLYLSSNVPTEENGWQGLNVSGFGNEEYDAACNEALQLLPGQPGYQESHRRVQRILAEQVPVIPLYQHIKTTATRPDMQGFVIDPTASEMWNIEAFDY